MANKIKVFKGDTLKGTINLKVIDACDQTIKNPYQIPASCEIAMNWPGSPNSIQLLKSLGEIQVVDATKGTLTYKMNPDKSDQLSVVTNEALDVIVTEHLTKTGDTVSASAVVSNISVTNIYVGGNVTGAGIPTGTKILSIDSSTQITLDQNATITQTGVSLIIDGEVTTFEKLKIVDIKLRDNP